MQIQRFQQQKICSDKKMRYMRIINNNKNNSNKHQQVEEKEVVEEAARSTNHYRGNDDRPLLFQRSIYKSIKIMSPTRGGGSRLYLLFLCSTIPNAIFNLFNSINKIPQPQLHDDNNDPSILLEPPYPPASFHHQQATPDHPTSLETINKKKIPSTTSTATTTFLESIHFPHDVLVEKLPTWMMEYYDWHQKQLAENNITNDNWQNFRFLIMRCSKRDPACGGTADRLKVLPLYLRIAYESQRILLIRWEQPYRLEEFLQPNTLYINWTVPNFLETKLHSDNPKGLFHYLETSSSSSTHDDDDERSSNNNKNLYVYIKGHNLYNQSIEEYPIIIESRRQQDDGGESLYKELTTTKDYDNKTYKDIFHYVFWSVFQPSQPITKIIDQQYTKLGLIPGQYSAAHLRNFYKRPMTKVSKKIQIRNAINAVNCTSQLLLDNNTAAAVVDVDDEPIYFASDSITSSQAVEAYAHMNNYSIRTQFSFAADATTTSGGGSSSSNVDPLHLDFAGRGNRTYPVEAYYDTFVDLLILGNARCISYGEGGYGIFANMLSLEPNCSSVHTITNKKKWMPKRSLHCDWKQQ